MKKLLVGFTLALACFVPTGALAKTVTGTVFDQSGEPLPGVSINVPGTKILAVTDAFGKYSVDGLDDNSQIRYYFVGTKPVVEKVGDRTSIDVKMIDDDNLLDEVLVIGYGSAKAKDLTSPIAVVKGEAIAQAPTPSPMSALQGKVTGLQVMSSGQPGGTPTVRIRGTGSFSAASPLYVVDGVQYGSIDFLNNDDIEEISVLKDASASAIYGVKAANGVVLVTTKRGRHDMPPRVTYNGYVGVQKVTKRMKMANSSEFATMLREVNERAYRSVLSGSIYLWGGDYDTNTYGADTDWYGELLRDAVITNHSLSIAGGSKKASYSMGVNYLYQNGIMKTENDYSRLNLRGALDYDVTKWLTTGFTTLISSIKYKAPNNGAWYQAYAAPSIIPVYDDTRTDAYPVKYASASQIGIVNNIINPVAQANYTQNSNKTSMGLVNFYADFKLIPDKLSLRTNYGRDFGSSLNRAFTPEFVVGPEFTNSTSALSKNTNGYDNWSWENTLTYKDKFGKHNVGAMAGYSMYENKSWGVWASGTEIPEEKEEYWYVSNGNAETAKGGDSGYRERSQSAFVRLNYDFDSKYFLMFTMRADGSSKFQQRWGYFPSVGAAWVISGENFMKDYTNINFLKLRASWGKLGNNNVAASDGFAAVRTGMEASGVYGNNIFPGFQNTVYYTRLNWEVVNETNVGATLEMFDSRLTADFDYYYRLTENAIISAKIPFSSHSLAGNYGQIENQGFELSANWTDRIGNFRYSVGGNVSFLHNRVKTLSGPRYIQGEDVTNQVGEKMNSFYGYKVIGVYQTEEEVAADPIAVTNGFKPGFLKFEDVNGDNVLDAKDYQTLGSYIPDVTYALNISLGYKNIDFSISGYGQAGAEIFNSKRLYRRYSAYYNFDRDQVKDRWHGPGTSNTQPSAQALFSSWTTDTKNSYAVESADFFRIQNINLGYTFRNIRMGSYVMPSLRAYLNAERPFTFYSCHSFTPEIPDALGRDNCVYPLAGTFTFGLQIDF